MYICLQQKLQDTIESLKNFLVPFNDIEDISNQLGIPSDPRGASITTQMTADLIAIDPRSSEFQTVLSRLQQCQVNLKQYSNFKDYDKYQKWLDQLQHRATSLVAKAMRDLLENASKVCMDLFLKSQTKGGQKGVEAADQPLESAPIYQKFRGLGFRMRELCALLRVDDKVLAQMNASAGGKSGRESHEERGGNTSKSFSFDPESIVAEVKQVYVSLRSNLLLPFIKETALSGLQKKIVSERQLVSSTDTGGDSTPSGALLSPGRPSVQLCYGIRQAYSTLLRVAQLEQHLFNSLFTAPDKRSSDDATDADSTAHSQTHSVTSHSHQMQAYQAEVLNIVETVNNIIIDFIRPLIISESNIDELCRIIVTLNEDIRGQFVNISASQNLVDLLLRNLDRVIFDSQERLSYCAETYMRLNVQMFDPLPSQTAFPDVLERAVGRSKQVMDSAATDITLTLDTKIERKPNAAAGPLVTLDSDTPEAATAAAGTENGAVIDNLSKTWYPSLRSTLSLLSKLYGIVDMGVFEDFARRCVRACMDSLQRGSDSVRKRNFNVQVHGDLFLIRHLLLLREQLAPFEVKLLTVEKTLDFKSARSMLTNLAANPRNLVRFDTTNGLLQLARDGLPATLERKVDVKQELDAVLRNGCNSFKANALKMALGPLITFVTKVEAFVGEIPIVNGGYAKGARRVPRAKVGSVGADSATAAPVAGAEVHEEEEDELLFSPEVRNSLKGQAFVKHDRIVDVLDSCQLIVKQSVPELRDFLKVSCFIKLILYFFICVKYSMLTMTTTILIIMIIILRCMWRISLHVPSC